MRVEEGKRAGKTAQELQESITMNANTRITYRNLDRGVGTVPEAKS